MEGSITHFLALIHTLYIIITKFKAIASSCQLSNLSLLAHSSLLSSKKFLFLFILFIFITLYFLALRLTY